MLLCFPSVSTNTKQAPASASAPVSFCLSPPPLTCLPVCPCASCCAPSSLSFQMFVYVSMSLSPLRVSTCLFLCLLISAQLSFSLSIFHNFVSSIRFPCNYLYPCLSPSPSVSVSISVTLVTSLRPQPASLFPCLPLPSSVFLFLFQSPSLLSLVSVPALTAF